METSWRFFGDFLRGDLVHRVPVVPVGLEDVLVDGVALLGIDLPRVLLGKPVQGLLDRDAHGGACLLLLAPVEDELLALEDREELLGDALDLLSPRRR